MRLVFFGTSEFAVPALEGLSDHIVLVVSQPDRASGRKLQVHPSPVKARALELGLPVVTPEKCRQPEFVEQIRSLEPDALLVAAYGQILPVSLLESAKQGAINLHGSILPFYRGAAPIQRAILNGDDKTGVTLIQMDKGMDTGDIIATETTSIRPNETYGELQNRLAVLAEEIAIGWMPRICEGDYPRVPQRNDLATMAPKIDRSETVLNPEKPAAIQYNRFRAFTPNPGVSLNSIFGPIRISRALLSDIEGTPGEVLAVKPELVVAFHHGSLILTELQPAGKKRQTGAEFANGVRLKVGDRLLEPTPIV